MGCLLPIPIKEDGTDRGLVDESISVNYEVEIGYILKKSAWGRGIATEIATELLKFGFEHGGLPVIVAVIDDDNIASRHMPGENRVKGRW